ncbi:MAG: pyridoxal phosphate-dependent aminotransferase family protein [Desulfobacterales bacterium]|nr:pyridoxal phosphate-dependent aminotransferase family protein [Desulfobacterales bacterium]
MHLLINAEVRQMAESVALLRARDIYTYGLEVSSACNHRVRVNGVERINFISNNYLGFSSHPRVVEAAGMALQRYGVGTGGSPLMCGTTTLHTRLKEKIAEAYQQEAAVLFASGYQAMLGAIQGTLGRGDLALIDQLVHRSIVDGVILSGCDKRMWLHNDMEDLGALLARTGGKYKRRLIAVDSVYSMDGDIADLPAIKALADRHEALILVDEAHSLGVIGPRGRGLLEHFALPEGAHIIAGTFSKFAGAVGGFVTGPADFITHLTHTASAFIFSASLPPVQCAAVLAAFQLLDEEPQWHRQLWENVRYLLDSLASLGFDTGRSQTPVIPLMIRDPEKAMLFNKSILERGVYASPVVHPAVAPAESRIRLGVMASHTREDLDIALGIFQKSGKELGLI